MEDLSHGEEEAKVLKTVRSLWRRGGGGGRNRSVSKARSFSKLPELMSNDPRDNSFKEGPGSFRKNPGFLDRRKMLWNFDPRKKDASASYWA